MTMDNFISRMQLSALWVFVLLNMLFRDVHEIGKPEFLEKALVTHVSEYLFLAAGVILEIPLLMIVLCLFLALPKLRWANIGAALLFGTLIIVNNLSPDLDDAFFAIVEVCALLFIIWKSWYLQPADDGLAVIPQG